ncbi:hypothetical protein EVAR_80820_1 [Eumeta japonica]|uniref:RNA-directed DNA polymerase from mobile element jockey n=1 Tax=Eumeta variegata TaxID=151549 RepID=A0A4C1WF73_EUMVA|nr:hypothetical protein EVAR_80820_1 [Eumeta japonica]
MEPSDLLLLVAIYNACINKVIFSDLWKEANVIGSQSEKPLSKSPNSKLISLLKTLGNALIVQTDRSWSPSKLCAFSYPVLPVHGRCTAAPKVELTLFTDDMALYTLDARPKALTHPQTAINPSMTGLGSGGLSKLSLRNKVMLFTASIRPILAYGGVVFTHIPSLLQNTQTTSFRTDLCAQP